MVNYVGFLTIEDGGDKLKLIKVHSRRPNACERWFLLLKFHTKVCNTIACETKETVSCVFKKEGSYTVKMDNEECKLFLSYQKVALNGSRTKAKLLMVLTMLFFQLAGDGDGSIAI